MSEVATLPAAAPAAPTAAAAAPAAAPAAPPAAPAAPAAADPAAPSAPESLIHGEVPTASPEASPAANSDPFADLLGKVPEKFHVKQDGKLDSAASLAKALEHREHLEKRLGAGDIPPKTPAEYGFQLPAEMAGLELKTDRMEAFKTKAHAAGFTQEQFQLAMASYLEAVPDLMEGAAKLTATQARAELSKVWTTPADIDANISAAQRAIKSLPADLHEATRALGTDPVFLRAMAHLGAQMVEDRGPGPAAGGGASKSVEELMRSPAYTDPKHPQHQSVSQQVAAHFRAVHGTTPL